MAIRFGLLRDISLVCLILTQAGCAQPLRPAILVGTAWANRKTGAEGIEIIRGGAQVKAKAKMALDVGDELRTNAVSRAVIQFPDESWVIVEPNTIVRISSLTLTRGTILANVRKLFQLHTEFVKVTVDGTMYRATVHENSQTSIDVAEGRTRLTSNTSSWEAVAVPEREQALVKGREVPKKQPLSPAEVMKIRQQLKEFATLFDIQIFMMGGGLGPGR